MIANLMRKTAVRMAEGKKPPFNINRKLAEEMLGHPDYLEKEPLNIDRAGVATGLAWTEVGGDVLQVECTDMAGTGKLILTGQVGQVMQESAQAALSFLRSNAKAYGLDENFFDKRDIHVHLPAGATPKDGPSAGITLATAIVSQFTGRRVRSDIAMTGEITLQGRVFPVGGLKEKILAAYRYNLKEVIMPALNKSAVDDIPKEVRDKLKFHFVNNLKEVTRIALMPLPGERDKTPRKKAVKKAAKKAPKASKAKLKAGTREKKTAAKKPRKTTSKRNKKRTAKK